MYLKWKKKVSRAFAWFTFRVSQQLGSVFQDRNFVHLTFARKPLCACLSFLTIPKSFSKGLKNWCDFCKSQPSSSSRFISLRFLSRGEKIICHIKIFFSQLFKKLNGEKLLYFLSNPRNCWAWNAGVEEIWSGFSVLLVFPSSVICSIGEYHLCLPLTTVQRQPYGNQQIMPWVKLTVWGFSSILQQLLKWQTPRSWYYSAVLPNSLSDL